MNDGSGQLFHEEQLASAASVALQAEAAEARLEAGVDFELEEAGRRDARGWPIVGRCRLRTALAARRIRAARAVLQASRNHGLLRPQSRLLRAASTDVRNTLRSNLALPSVTQPGASGRLPRVYAAARGYWKASRFRFREELFARYMAAAQGPAPFELAELWLLKPMLQLGLLEELQSALAKPGDNQQRASVLLAALQDLGQADLKFALLDLSRTEAILREDPAGVYARMDYESRESYRAAIQELARYTTRNEFEIAAAAVALAREAASELGDGPSGAHRRCHAGYYLIAEGRSELEERIAYRPQGAARVRGILRRSPDLIYFLAVELLTFAAIAFVLLGLMVGVPFLAAILLLLLPASEAAIEVVNQLVTSFVLPRALPKMDFAQGIPADCATMVAIPTLLTSRAQMQDMVRNLEIRFVGNRDPNLYFALLTDLPDSEAEVDERDDFPQECSRLIEELNAKYGHTGRSPFFLFHRNRVFNAVQNVWMGWERKRGKLLDFNELLRGGEDRFPAKTGDLTVLPKIRYVITLDSDTQLPRDAARRMIGAMAHPLNRAEIDKATNTVTQGYGVLQPRVGISVHSASQSRLANIYSGQTGLDIYTCAVSDVYQDLFGEGSFTGKGIYDVDVFREVLGGRFPSNAILSHDLIEGAYVRAGLLSDVEVIDDYPSHFSAHSRRKHRWVRGDWQILRWILPRVPDGRGLQVRNPLNFLSRWKIFDNLRRSVIESATLALLLAAWFFLPGSPGYWTAATVALFLIPSWMQLLLAVPRILSAEDRASEVRVTADAFIAGQVSVFVFIAFLLHQTLVTLDAVARTVFRLTISHRNLLEWETAAQAELEERRQTPVDTYLDSVPFVAVILALLLWATRPESLPAAAPVLMLWFLSKPLASWLDRPVRAARSAATDADEVFLRRIALRTWRFFAEHLRSEDHFLIPDNVQEADGSAARRISPTNLGMALNAQVAAYELGFISAEGFTGYSEKILESARKLPRFRGHFYNWYATDTLATLEPKFISSVDSGNLACSLWALEQACLALLREPLFHPRILRGAREILEAAHGGVETPAAQPNFAGWLAATPERQALSPRASEEKAAPDGKVAIDSWWLRHAETHLAELREDLLALAPWWDPEFRAALPFLEAFFRERDPLKVSLDGYRQFAAGALSALDVSGWTGENGAAAARLRERLEHAARYAESLRLRLKAIADECAAFVDQMDFAFLFDTHRRLLSVGYDVTQGRLAASCYDLLASEARSAAFIAVAKGDIPQSSWFHLGRAHTRYAGQRPLLSWTGTMFEYLMPLLWMRVCPSTLLENSMRAAVRCQIEAMRPFGIPWGVSEGACTARNEAGHYKYHAFGLPALALKEDTVKRAVITPYAACLALQVAPAESVRNLKDMEARGWFGRLGFYESADFGEASAKGITQGELARCWMAHHQGMILLSICNLLSDFALQRRFHQRVDVAATERILHERPASSFPVEFSES